MNINELQLALRNEKIDEKSYSLIASHFDPDEALCLRQDERKWLVYYSERGLKTGIRTFETETDACLYMLQQLLVDPTTRIGWSSGFGVTSDT